MLQSSCALKDGNRSCLKGKDDLEAVDPSAAESSHTHRLPPVDVVSCGESEWR